MYLTIQEIHPKIIFEENIHDKLNHEFLKFYKTFELIRFPWDEILFENPHLK